MMNYEINMKKQLYWILVGMCVSAFIMANIYFLNKSNDENLSYQFNGAVTNIRYDVKALPYVTVDSIEYYLDAPWGFENRIQIGDIIKKKKGDWKVTLIKKNNQIYTFTP